METKYDEATGYKLCKRGHERTPENVNKNGNCKICMGQKTSEWAKNNRVKVNETKRKWRHENIEAARSYERNKYAQNPISSFNKSKRWRIKNDEYVKEYKRLYDKAHQPQLLEIKRMWRAKNPTKIKQYQDKATAFLPDGYVASKMGLKLAETNKEIIEIKRLTIRLKRSLKNGNQI